MSLNKKTVELLKKIKKDYPLSKEDAKVVDQILSKYDQKRQVELDKQFISATWLHQNKAPNFDKLEKLLSEGANVDGTGFVGNHGDTALQKCADRGEWETVKFLVAHGADIHLKDKDGHACIHIWANNFNQSRESLELLLSLGSEINEETADGKTALFLAADKRRQDCMQWLLELGADIDFKDKDGKTVIEYAKGSKAGSFLEEYKANRDNQVLMGHIAADEVLDCGLGF